MIRRPPRSTHCISSAASDVYKRQVSTQSTWVVQAAGWPIWPLLLASVISVALIIERLVALRRSKVVPNGLLQRAVGEFKRGANNDKLLDELESHSPLGRVLSAGLRTKKRKKKGNKIQTEQERIKNNQKQKNKKKSKESSIQEMTQRKITQKKK
eukprot:TRINITY_DN1065_c0_g1_i3.p1 TRINITY_DN1065_c0_g1~~TRINITY_DN1065_c0_g1_i3.p1  ORF type:complete len:155 (+),score=41.22 TRINITY_DN1065_c0_g1_i3:126-590(+)